MRELSERYAQALYALYQDEVSLRAAADTFTGNAALFSALTNPCVALSEKERVVDAVLPGAAHELRSFFKLLCRHGRLELLSHIPDAYRALDLSAHNAADATMRAAFAPSAEELAAIADALAAKYGKERVELTVVPAPELLGGFTLTIGSETYDKSILGAARQLKAALA